MSKFSIVAAFQRVGRGIGKGNNLPWDMPKDMKRFRDITKGGTVIMGRNTWESLPKMLPGRHNVVISRTKQNLGHSTPSSFEAAISGCQKLEANNVFVIGGEQVFREGMDHPNCDKLYITKVNTNEECDTFFPEIPHHFKVVEKEQVDEFLEFSTYENWCDYNSDEYQYLDLVRDIIENGEYKEGRNGGTFSLCGPQHTFDLEKGFPLLTTKKMFFRGIVEELLFFLRGDTDSKLLEEKGVNIWRGNTTREFLDSRGLHHYKEGDMGPMYGYLWRHFGTQYDGANNNNYKGYDQLYHLLDNIVNDPSSRRLLLTTYDPSLVSQSVLAPCHGLTTQFFVSNDKKLSCKMYQRSVDVGLGYPFNIASYGALVHILCAVTGLNPGKLIMTLGDAHIYENHVDKLRKQLERTPYRFPMLEGLPEFSGQTTNDMLSYIESLTEDNFRIVDYHSHPRIRMDMVA